MRQFGLDTVYSGLNVEQDDKSLNQNFVLDVNDADNVSIFDLVTQGYGHDKALSAYVGEALDVMMEAVIERSSLDPEDDTLYCCACAACSGEQEAGPVLIDGYVTLASLLEAEISYGTDETFLSNVLADSYGMDAAEAAQFLFNPTTGEFVWVEGFDGVLTKGATLTVKDGLGIVNAGGSSTTATAAATGDQRIDAVINGDYWAGGSISYAFSLSAAAYEYAGTGNEALPDNFNDVISAMQEASAHFALSSTEGVAAAIGFSVEGFTNLDVNFLGNVDSTTAEIRFAETADPGTGTARVADFPGGQVTSSPNDDGDIWFGTANNFRIAEAGNYQWMTMIHEIGHALGLKHGHQNYNFGVLPSDRDSTEFSIMTYRSYIGQDPSGGATNEQWGFPQTFMMFDIATLQYFYGADFNVNAGDTVYSWTPGSGDTMIDGVVAIEPGGNRIYATIWDGDGVDTFDLSAYSTDLSIDLSPGGWSVFDAAQLASIGGGNFARGNIFNALQYQGDARSLIENATGGSGDDTFVGNAADNYFDGGAGVDTADYSDITDDLSVSLEAMGGAFSVEAGNDSFDAIENFFSGSGNDNIGGSVEDNFIKGGEGDDIVDGMDGNDVLWGEVGNDTLFGGLGNDILRGGNDLGLIGMMMGDGEITRAAGAGNDTIANALNIDDEYSLDADSDILNATTIPHVTVTATGDGTVHFYAFTAYGPNTTIVLDIDYGETGGAGSFNSFLELFDSAGNSLATNDLYPFPGGGTGSTSSDDAFISFVAPQAGTYYIAVSESGGGGVPVDATYELNVSVEDTSITDPDMGDDILDGGEGDDMLFGGLGSDSAQYLFGNQADFTVTDNMDGTYSVTDNVGNAGTDILDNIEFLIFADGTVDIVTAAGGASGGMVIDGTPGDDTLTGTSGDDTITGFEGNDIIDAGAGNDLIILDNSGQDTVDGGDGFDTVQFTNTGIGSIVFFDVGMSITTLDIIVYSFTGGTFINTLSNVERFEQLDTSGGLQILALNLDGTDNVLDLSSEAILGQAHVFGSDGNDTITAGAGYSGVVAPQSFLNPNYANYLFGGEGTNTVTGNIFNDFIGGGSGVDTLDGGAGEDNITYRFSSAAVTVNLATQTVSGGWATGDTISNFERAIGSDGFGDTLIGGADNNILLGIGGDDIIDGGEGDDVLEGGIGADTLTGGLGADIFSTITYESETDTITDLETTDLILFATTPTVTPNFIGTAAFNFIAGEVRYEIAGGQTTLEIDVDGDGVADKFIVAANGAFDFATTTSPIAGRLALSVSAATSGSIDGTSGNDNLTGTSGDDVINGLAGNDILDGLAGDDTLNGGDGADRLLGGAGADVMNGDAGFDSADYRGATSRVAFNVDTGGTVGDAAGDTFSGIERYYLSDFNDTVTGSDANEFFYGEDGNDTINAGGGIDRVYGGDGNDIQRGQDGNDQLYGSAGSDQLNGGTGFDVANYSFATAAVTVNMLAGGTSGDATGDTYFGIEAVYGSNFNDSLTGNNSVNELRGGDGDDALFGLGGNDRFFGDAGADSFDGGTGTDIVNYTTAAEGVFVDLVNGGSMGEANGDSYTSIEWVFGSAFDDFIYGDDGNNRLEGRDGNDDLAGGAGNDRLLGGDGNDTIFGGDGVDTIFGQEGDDLMFGDAGNDFFFSGAGADFHDGGDGFDTVSYLSSSIGLTIALSGSGSTGDAAGDSFNSIERILGTGHDDIILGDFENDILIGNGGNDYLAGGNGNDSLNGGAGVDSFGYDEVVDGADVIQGFTTNEVIYLLGGDMNFDTWAEVQAVGTDAGANVIFDFGFGNTLTIVGHNLADLDASNFDFSGTPPAAAPLADPDAFAGEPVDVLDMDALI